MVREGGVWHGSHCCSGGVSESHGGGFELEKDSRSEAVDVVPPPRSPNWRGRRARPGGCNSGGVWAVGEKVKCPLKPSPVCLPMAGRQYST